MRTVASFHERDGEKVKGLCHSQDALQRRLEMTDECCLSLIGVATLARFEDFGVFSQGSQSKRRGDAPIQLDENQIVLETTCRGLDQRISQACNHLPVQSTLECLELRQVFRIQTL